MGELVLNHASSVREPVIWREAGLPMSTYWFAPLNENAWSTTPGTKVTPFTSEPLFVPWMSLAFPSPGHHPTSPAVGTTHVDLHIPALPARYMAVMSLVERARLKMATSS